MNNWKNYKLGDILKVKSGKDKKSIECEAGKYQILGTGGEIGRTNSFLYNKPSVLIGRKGTIDKPIYKENPFWTVDTLFYTEIKHVVLPKYVYYLFLTINWPRYNEASGVPSLTSTTIEKIRVRLPDLETQQKIVQILDAARSESKIIDRQIEKEREALESLCQKTIYSNAPNSKLGDVINLASGYAFKSTNYVEGGKYHIITIANVQDKTISLSKTNHINELPNDLQKHQILDLGDIILSMTGNVGRVARINVKNCLLNQRVGKIIPKAVDSDYLYYLLTFGRFKKYMQHKAQGGAQSNLSNKDIGSYPIYLPDIEEQKRIARYLCCQSLIIANLEKLRSLKNNQYRYLLNHLISGDFDLSNIRLETKESK